MKSSPGPASGHKLLEQVQLPSGGPFQRASTFELTSTVQYAIEANLPNTLTTLLRELGRRGGLVVSVQPVCQPLRAAVAAPQMRSQA